MLLNERENIFAKIEVTIDANYSCFRKPLTSFIILTLNDKEFF